MQTSSLSDWPADDETKTGFGRWTPAVLQKASSDGTIIGKEAHSWVVQKMTSQQDQDVGMIDTNVSQESRYRAA